MEKTSIKRKMVGTVVSAKTKQMVLVETSSVKVHPKYHKRFQVTKKFAAHVDSGEYALGDKVEIEECPPKSKTKHWLVIRKIS